MAPKKRTLKPLPFFDENAVFTFLEENGYKELHAYTLWKAVIQSRPENLKEVALPSVHQSRHCLLLPVGLLDKMSETFAICTSKVVETHVSSDGTTKLLIELQDGQRVESVIIKHQGRNTLCVSSQLGCAMACSFCATGTMGIKGNLMGGEICEQLYHANAIAPIRNVVYMGMGEPLQNYPAVISSFRAMTDIRRFGLSHHQVTISTVGVIPMIRQLSKDAPYISLALSLHAANQELRAKIVPSAKAFPIQKLLEACWEHIKGSKKPLFVEYILLANVNDRPEHAHELGQLLAGRDVVVNLIPYNPTDVAMDFEIPDDADIDVFYKIIASQYKILCTIRRHHGRDIGGACGQLALVKPGQGGGGEGAPAVMDDIEDLMSGKGGGAAGNRKGGGAALIRKKAGNTGRKEEGAAVKDEETAAATAAAAGGGKDGEEEKEDDLSWKNIPEFVSCSKTTWLLTLTGAAVVALAVGLTVFRVGLTVYVLRDPSSSSAAKQG